MIIKIKDLKFFIEVLLELGFYEGIKILVISNRKFLYFCIFKIKLDLYKYFIIYE